MLLHKQPTLLVRCTSLRCATKERQRDALGAVRLHKRRVDANAGIGIGQCLGVLLQLQVRQRTVREKEVVVRIQVNATRVERHSLGKPARPHRLVPLNAKRLWPPNVSRQQRAPRQPGALQTIGARGSITHLSALLRLAFVSHSVGGWARALKQMGELAAAAHRTMCAKAKPPKNKIIIIISIYTHSAWGPTVLHQATSGASR